MVKDFSVINQVPFMRLEVKTKEVAFNIGCLPYLSLPFATGPVVDDSCKLSRCPF